MRGQLPLGLFAIVFGALETAGGTQELVYLGISRSQTYPLIAGTSGAVAGGLLLAAGIALLIRSRLARDLARAAAWVSVPVFMLVGVITRRAGWSITTVSILMRLLLVWFCAKNGKTDTTVSQT